ncbi:MAG TPA: secretin N-terminal domain-containing protein, partial [Armatimonadota bacterium]|nr:secretin N-terminal domain-containing protein [Armatimonadota bacterium]
MTRFIRLLSATLLIGTLFVGIGSRALAQGTPLVIVPKRANPNQLISFSFQQADIDDVLRFLADASGKMVFKDSSVATAVTIRNQSQIPVARAIRLVQTILALKGFALTETEDALIVTTTADARARRSTRVSAGRDIAGIPEGKEIITHIFPLRGADAVRLREELQGLFPGGTTAIVANADTNSLVVVDEADNVRRIAQIITLLDRDLTDEITVEVIRLTYADATEVARYMTELFRADETTRPQGQQQQPFGPGGPGGPGAAAAAGARSGLAQLRGRVRFAADTRSNSLIVYASPANIKTVKTIIDQLDVNLAPRTEYRILELKYADATGLADQLNQLLDPNATGNRGGAGFFAGFGGGNNQRPAGQERGLQEFRVVPDVRTNSLIVTAPVDGVETLENLVKQLDRPSQVEDVVRVFQLQNAIASETATTLRSLFQGTQQQGGFGFALFGAGQRGQIPPNSPLDLLRQVTIVPNDQTNQLLISGPSQTFPVIEELLRTDEGGLDRRLPQVFIEVVIADITLDERTKFGIEFNAMAGTSSVGTNFGLTAPNADTGGFRYSILSRNFQATLQALRANDKVRIVSTPHVMVTDNSPALVTIGESIPYAGQTTITNGVAQTSVEFQEVAITLNVTPHISPGNNILMDIDQVVNSLLEFITVAPGQLAPRTTSRRAGTTVIVEDNQTVVLGGIISNNDQRRVNKVPLLGDIPILGQFFRNTEKSRGRTELVVFLTPHIVRDPKDAEDIRKYERSRLQVDPLKQLNAPFSKPLDFDEKDLRPGGKADLITPPRSEENDPRPRGRALPLSPPR